MSEQIVIDRATTWAEFLTQRHYRGAGDTIEAAMSRAARKADVPFGVFWRLRYSQARDIWASAYLKLQDAYDDECQRQEAKLRHEVELLKRTLGDAATHDPVVMALDSAIEALEAKGGQE